MLNRLAKSWFLVSLLILLPSGMIVGWFTSPERRLMTAGRIQPAVMTSIILFLMAFTLDSTKLAESFRSPRPVLWGCLVNLGLLPLMAVPLVFLHETRDLSLGLMIAASVPCTLATASVSTRQAEGNDAVSLLVTLATNVVGVIVTPLWLQTTVAAGVDVDPRPLIAMLAITVLLPTLLGQACRLLRKLGSFANRRRFEIGIVAQGLVLVVVTKTAVEAGGRLREQQVWPAGTEFLLLALECAALHLVAMFVAERGAVLLSIPREDRIATLFAGSQKTLPVGLLLAAVPSVSQGTMLPFVTFPILLFHAVQLICDSAIADRIACQQGTNLRHH